MKTSPYRLGTLRKYRENNRERMIYHQAKRRCTNQSYPRYDRYGGRGIEFRFESFEQFINEVGPRPKGYWLERIDNDGHYESGNVKWVTPQENLANRR